MESNQKYILRVYIGKMNYFNAADSAQFALERAKRDELKAAFVIDVTTWVQNGIKLVDVKDFVNDNSTLCNFNDFMSNNMINAIYNNSLGVEI